MLESVWTTWQGRRVDGRHSWLRSRTMTWPPPSRMGISSTVASVRFTLSGVSTLQREEHDEKIMKDEEEVKELGMNRLE